MPRHESIFTLLLGIPRKFLEISRKASEDLDRVFYSIFKTNCSKMWNLVVLIILLIVVVMDENGIWKSRAITGIKGRISELPWVKKEENWAIKPQSHILASPFYFFICIWVLYRHCVIWYYYCNYCLLTMTIVGTPVWAMTVVKVTILSMALPYLHSFMNKWLNILTEIWLYLQGIMSDLLINRLKKRYYDIISHGAK